MHRIAEAAQAIDVAAQGAGGDPQAGGEIGTGPVTLGLKQRKQAKESCRGLQHTGKTIALIEDRICPQLLIAFRLSIRGGRT